MSILHKMPRLLSRLAVLLLFTGVGAALAQSAGVGPTPPRLSLVEGQVSFWRPGAEEWSVATLNTPLAPGDALYVADNANLELQIGSRAFVRAGERTQLNFIRQDAHSYQFRVDEGAAAFDLRTLPAGLRVEVDTPNASFTMDHTGYYRLNVDKDASAFITRRGGQATALPVGNPAYSMAPSQELVVTGDGTPSVQTSEAPEPDAWDRWNAARTDEVVAPASARHLPPDVYGADALDQHGEWRTVPSYGAVWEPYGLSPGWVPYSRGHWIWDPFYGWTWIDDAPWGWAPFHYGRWVYLSGFWAWAPGPVTVRSIYAPALVVFFNSGGGVSLSIGTATPMVSWVALSWGEPLTPWWGPRGFVGRPWWGGWHGPRVAHPATFQNTRISHAVIAVQHDQFGHGPVRATPVSASALPHLSPVPGPLPVKPSTASLAAGPTTSVRPPHEAHPRPAMPPPTPRIPHPIVPRRMEPPPAPTSEKHEPPKPVAPRRIEPAHNVVRSEVAPRPAIPPHGVTRPEAAPPRAAMPHEAPRKEPEKADINRHPKPAAQPESRKEEHRAVPSTPAIHNPVPVPPKHEDQERDKTPKHHGPGNAPKCDEKKGACDR